LEDRSPRRQNRSKKKRGVGRREGGNENCPRKRVDSLGRKAYTGGEKATLETIRGVPSDGQEEEKVHGNPYLKTPPFKE